MRCVRHPDEGARSLTADASLQWGQLLPVIRVLAEPPAPSFTRIIQPSMSEVLELEWWTRHPGQVSVSDRGERKTPLTLWVDMAPQGLLFNGYELEESQIIDHVRATSKVSSGGAVPVLLRVHESIHWGRVLELAAHLDSALETGRVALWHEPLSQSD